MGEHFREKLEEALRIKFRGLKFRGLILCLCSCDVNFKLGTRNVNIGLDVPEHA